MCYYCPQAEESISDDINQENEVLEDGENDEGEGNNVVRPTDTTTQNATAGVSGNYGQGGAPESAGVSGFVVIKQMS